MSTEQRDKAAVEIRDRILPSVQTYAQMEGLSDLGTVQAGIRLGAQAGWDAHAATMPDLDALTEAIWGGPIAGFDRSEAVEIAEVILALLNKEVGE